MAEYLSPGIYMEEVSSGIKPMEGVSTSTAGFVGVTERGSWDKAVFISSFSEYKRKFGGYLDENTYAGYSYLPHAVEQFFANGGSRCYVVRALFIGSDDTKKCAVITKTVKVTEADSSFKDKEVDVQFTAKNEGAWGLKTDFVLEADKADAKRFHIALTRGEYSEDYQSVSFCATDPNYITKALINSELFTVTNVTLHGNGGDQADDEGETAAVLPLTTEAAIVGTDTSPGNRTGLKALLDVQDISIIACPGATSDAVYKAMINQCDALKNRVCILDIDKTKLGVDAIKGAVKDIKSSYAAIYHPWVAVYNPASGSNIWIPPSGSVAGIYARVDSERGVHKAPANEIIRGATSLSVNFGKPEQDMLNPAGINLIRSMPGLGIRVWGARTLSSDSSLKYVNVRRLLIYIEESILKNTGWVVFEPNDQLLWTKVRSSLTAFLGTLWRDGALMGAKEEQAFFVHIGLGETMTQDDVLNGRLICSMGIAPVRPAEFVIFRVTQNMQSVK